MAKHLFLLVLAPLVIGILLAFELDFTFLEFNPIENLLIGILFALLLLHSRSNTARFFLILLIGLLALSFGKVVNDKLNYGKLVDRIAEKPLDEIALRIEKTFKGRNNYHRSIAEVYEFLEDSTYVNSGLKALIYHRRDLQFGNENGSLFHTRKAFKVIDSKRNSNSYLKRKNVRLMTFINERSDFLKLENPSKDEKQEEIHKAIKERFIKFFDYKHSASLASALFLGDRSEIDRDLQKSFSKSGVMHVMAVSGLHVGLIYMLISKLFFLLRRIPGGNFIEQVVILTILWLYAGLIGMTPSVVRACLMLNFYQLSILMQRKLNPINLVSFSLLTALAINPSMIYNVGLQLSHLAVAGIVLFYNKLNGLWSTSNRISRYIWPICCVSIAAQSLTFPLTLYYFNGFPIYFLLSNILISGLIFAILVLCIVLAIGFGGDLILASTSYMLDALFSLMTYMLNGIASLPFSFIELKADGLAVILLYICVALFIYRLFARRRLHWSIGYVCTAFTLSYLVCIQ